MLLFSYKMCLLWDKIVPKQNYEAQREFETLPSPFMYPHFGPILSFWVKKPTIFSNVFVKLLCYVDCFEADKDEKSRQGEFRRARTMACFFKNCPIITIWTLKTQNLKILKLSNDYRYYIGKQFVTRVY